MLNRIPTNFIPWIVLAASMATLSGAYFFQYGLGYVPCHLCLQERIPYIFAIGAALIAGILSREANLGIAPVVFIGLCALAFAIGSGLSGYHAGVEYKWWAGPATCTGGGLLSNSLQDLQAQLQGGTHAPRCDSAAWSLFGISLAGFNLLISLALCILSSLPVLRYFREAQGERV
ncbi:MAG: disulfide bond formation protein B [Parvibaculum sp.]|uniref:disulfide bond formation protein B n=1 Tax=Parvibaculum sp. TaxID=2024848 RepID=UPI003C70E873